MDIYFQPGSAKKLPETFILRYGISILLPALAIGLALRLPLGGETPWVLCFCGIVLSASYGGLTPAILSLLFSTAAISFLFVTSVHQLFVRGVELEDMTRLGVFVILALMTSCFIAGCRETNQKLRANHEWYHFLARTASDAIISTSEKEEILFVNRAAETLIGYAADQMVGRKLSWILERNPAMAPISDVHLEIQQLWPRSMAPPQSNAPHPGRTLNVFREGGKSAVLFVLRDSTPTKSSETEWIRASSCFGYRSDVNVTVWNDHGPEFWTPTPYLLSNEARFQLSHTMAETETMLSADRPKA